MAIVQIIGKCAKLKACNRMPLFFVFSFLNLKLDLGVNHECGKARPTRTDFI